MTPRLGSLIPYLACLCLAAGCAMPLIDHPPQSRAQLDAQMKYRGQEYTPRTIALHNVQRVLSPKLSADDRLESLRVVEKVDSDQAEVYAALATALTDKDTPPAVRQAVLEYLGRKGFSGVSDYVPAPSAATPAPPPAASPASPAPAPAIAEPPIQAPPLEWLEAHPAPARLPELVKLWASDKAGSVNEDRYRRLAEKMSGKGWEAALLEALNSADFGARGSAWEVLLGRMPPEQLRARVATLKARTDTVKAVQYFSVHFDYVPLGRRELLEAVTLYSAASDRLLRAAEFANRWQGEYRFNVRDFHLLSQLAGDPLRRPLSRQQLILEVSTALAKHRGGRATDPAIKDRMFRRGKLVDFDSQTDRLALPDLWNLMLFGEMLERPRVHNDMMATAEQDRADRQTQYGGLIVYDQGQAEARLYPPGARHGDDQYLPSDQMLHDAADALGFFVCHFAARVRDGSNIGPGRQELDLARELNLYELVFTSLDGGRINAMYVNPDGVVIDLGEY